MIDYLIALSPANHNDYLRTEGQKERQSNTHTNTHTHTITQIKARHGSAKNILLFHFLLFIFFAYFFAHCLKMLTNVEFSPPVPMETIQNGRQTKEVIRSSCQRYCMLT